MVYLSSNEVGNFPAKTCQSEQKKYSPARKPISVRHFVNRPVSELSHVIKVTITKFTMTKSLSVNPLFNSGSNCEFCLI